MQASEILRNARHALYERGWAQRYLESPSGHLCSIGALNLATFGVVEPLLKGTFIREADRAANILRHAMMDVDSTQGDVPIHRWNDFRLRTFDQIVEAFEKAEKLALIAEEPDATI